MSNAQLAVLVTILGGISGATVGFIQLQKWLSDRREKREAEIKRDARQEYETALKDSFIYEVATNHLPHLYDGLKLIAESLGVKLPEPPPIKYLPFDPTKDKP